MCVPVRPRFHVLPGHVPVTFEDFCRDFATRSLALDGFCPGLTQHRFTETSSHMTIDHHGPQANLLLRVSCEQVHSLILNDSFFYRFVDERGVFAPDVYASHPDEDVATCFWLLRNAKRVREDRLPRLETLLWIEGRMDATAGTFRFPPGYDQKLKRTNYVFQPYRQFKQGGGLARKQSREYMRVIDEIGKRITGFVDGETHELGFDIRHEVLATGPCWKMIREIGLHARREIFLDGTHGFISVEALGRDDQGVARFRYIMGAQDTWGSFKAAAFGRYLNEVEGCGAIDPWGGNDTVWGSPQGSGSLLPPDRVQALCLQFHAQRR